MTTTAQTLREHLAAGMTVDVRGDGKAGGGLVLVMQTLGAALAERPDLDVQDWPLFSSARKGANVRAFLRVAKGHVEMASQVTEPDIAILMNEAAASTIDFAEGTGGGMYVVNTSMTPAEAATKYRLGGTVATINGDALGLKHLGRPLGNIAIFAAIVRTSELITAETGLESLLHIFEKRRLPQRIIDQNRALFLDAFEHVSVETFPETPETDHHKPHFKGYGALPVGAQAALRASHHTKTSGYGRPGVRIEFEDAKKKCNGCSLCVVACPEGIIQYTPDPARGTLVWGAKFDDFCKGCRECIAACPLDLFREVDTLVRPEGVIEG